MTRESVEGRDRQTDRKEDKQRQRGRMCVCLCVLEREISIDRHHCIRMKKRREQIQPEGVKGKYRETGRKA